MPLSFNKGQDPTSRGGSGDPASSLPLGGYHPHLWRAWWMLSLDPHVEEAGEKGEILGEGARVGENAKPIKTPFTVASVKLYRDFSTHDMNNNHAFFSVIAKPTTPMRPFAGRIIAGRRPRAGGPAEGARCPGRPGNRAAAFRRSQLASARLPPRWGSGCLAGSIATSSGRDGIALAWSRAFSSPD